MAFNFDNSKIEKATCPAAFVASSVHNRSGINQLPWAELGNAVHKALEHYYTNNDYTGALELLANLYDEIIPVGTVPEVDHMFKKEVLDNVDAYLTNNPIHSLPFFPISMERTIGVRLRDLSRIFGQTVTFWFKQDMLVEEKTSGAYAVLDHKTRWGRITDYWLDKFNHCSQFTGYIWGSRQAAPKHRRVQNKVYVNLIQMAKLPNSERKCKTHKMKYCECRKLHASSELRTVGRTEEQLSAWRRDLNQMAAELYMLAKTYSKLEDLKHVPRLGTFRYRGEPCVHCSFKNWCRTGFDVGLMDTFTKESKWEPWNDPGAVQVNERY
jgi:hypothetical protein